MTIETPTIAKPAWATRITTPKQSGDPKSILLYGFPGRRKTTTAATIAQVPGIRKVLLVDFDNGAEALAKRDGVNGIDVLPISSLERNAFGQMNEVVDYYTHIETEYDAVIWDSIDIMQDIAERAFKKKYEGSKNTFAVYGELGEWTDSFVRAAHENPNAVHIFVAHAKEQTTETGAYRILPKLSGSSKESLAAIPSLVGYMEFATHPETNERHATMVVGESEKFVTKNRFELPHTLIDPTMPSIYAQIRANNSAQKSTAPAAATK